MVQKKTNSDEQLQITRLRIPREGEILGVVERRLGASRMEVRCLDGHTRICRIPGRLKRYLWVREGDIVIVEPWEHGGDEKADVVYKYNKTQAAHLEKKGYLRKLAEFQEF